MSRGKDTLHRANPSARQRPSKGPGATWRPENHDHLLFPPEQKQELTCHKQRFSQAKYLTEHVSSGPTAGEEDVPTWSPQSSGEAPARFPQTGRQTAPTPQTEPADVPGGREATTPQNPYSAFCVETPRTALRHEHLLERTWQKRPLLAACPQPIMGQKWPLGLCLLTGVS